MQALWYSGGYLHWLLAPLAWLYAGITALRRWLYRRGIFASHAVGVPVVVVGNLTVGGTGKTPVTIWLADQLRSRGYRPGIVSRGYGAIVGDVPVQANADSDPAIVGDEPLLMAIRSRCPVVVHPDRVAAARELVAIGVDVILSDDGLQHYRLRRDQEIAVVDGARGFGNRWLLPAGPLREPVSRLGRVSRVLVQVASRETAETVPGLDDAMTSRFHLVGHELVSLDGTTTCSFADLSGDTVHAVAAIGNPERFFRSLEARGLAIERHPFPDHAQFTPRDLAFDDERPVIMTEKDAVKCREFATTRHWYVPVDVEMHDDTWLDDVDATIRQSRRSNP